MLNREAGKQGIKFLGVLAVMLIIAGCEMSSGDSGSSPSTNTDPTPSGVDLSVSINRSANTVTVTGDTGAVTLSLPMGGATVSGTIGSPIDLTGLGLLNTSVEEVIATTANGSTRFAAMAPLATATQNQDALKAKLEYSYYGLMALNDAVPANFDGTASTLMDDFSIAITAYNNAVTAGAMTESYAATKDSSWNIFSDGVLGVPTHLVTVNGTYILPNIADILSYYETNTANAEAFYEAMFKIWWNKLDPTNDTIMNTAIKNKYEANYLDVESIE